MKTSCTVYFTTKTAAGRREKHDIHYTDIQAIRAGKAIDILGDDAAGNGIPYNAPILQIILSDGNTATYDANNVTVLF